MPMKQIPKLRQLRALIEVSKRGSVSQAAQHLNLSQPAITRSIKSLEKEFGVILFSRSSKRMTLTMFGDVLLKRVNRAISHLERADKELSKLLRSKKNKKNIWHLSKFSLNHEIDAVIFTAEYQSVSLAAKNIGVSQPAVNRSLRSIEQRLNRDLFQRTSRGMIPTREGEIVVKRLKIAYSEIVKAVEEVDNLKGIGWGKINIGVLPLARIQLVPIAVENFLDEFPEVQISIAEGMYESQIRRLGQGDLDFIVGTIREQDSKNELVAHKLFDESSVLVVRAEHPILQSKKIKLQNLKDMRWVIPHPKVPLRVLFEQLFANSNLPFPSSYVETDSLMVVRSLLLESDRIALVSKSQVYLDEKLGLLKIVPIDLKTPLRPIGIVTRADFSPTPNLVKFLTRLQKVASKIESQNEFL